MYPLPPPPRFRNFFLSEVRFELANAPTHPQNQNFFYLKLDLSWLMYQPTTPGLKKSSKHEIFVFGLHSTSDDQQSNPSDKSQLKCQ